MNDMIKTLMDEHEKIISAVGMVNEINELVGKNDLKFEKLSKELIGVFKDYGDQYHHQKEENILFPEMNKKNVLLQEGVIKEMFENHSDFRDMLSNAETLIAKKDYSGAGQQLHKYGESLLDHIAVENDEVFQMAESLFDDGELQKIYFRFQDKDAELGIEKKKQLEDQINDIRNSISKN